jgi:hypothetical protein
MGALQGLRTGEALTDAWDVVSPNMQVSADIIHGNILPSHPPLRSRERAMGAQRQVLARSGWSSSRRKFVMRRDLEQLAPGPQASSGMTNVPGGR